MKCPIRITGAVLGLCAAKLTELLANAHGKVTAHSINRQAQAALNEPGASFARDGVKAARP
jgi:hypothetical protein